MVNKCIDTVNKKPQNMGLKYFKTRGVIRVGAVGAIETMVLRKA